MQTQPPAFLNRFAFSELHHWFICIQLMPVISALIQVHTFPHLVCRSFSEDVSLTTASFPSTAACGVLITSPEGCHRKATDLPLHYGLPSEKEYSTSRVSIESRFKSHKVCSYKKLAIFTTNVDAENQCLINHKCVCGGLNRHFCQTAVVCSSILSLLLILRCN